MQFPCQTLVNRVILRYFDRCVVWKILWCSAHLDLSQAMRFLPIFGLQVWLIIEGNLYWKMFRYPREALNLLYLF